MFYLLICFNQQNRLWFKALPLFSHIWIPSVTSLSFAKFWMNVLVVLLFNMFQPKLLTCIVFYVKIVKLETQQDIFQSRRRFSCKSIKQKLSDTFMQLTRVFSGHIFQNCFNFEESAWETYPCECMRACKRVKYFENLPLSCVTVFGMSCTYSIMSPIYLAIYNIL